MSEQRRKPQVGFSPSSFPGMYNVVLRRKIVEDPIPGTMIGTLVPWLERNIGKGLLCIDGGILNRLPQSYPLNVTVVNVTVVSGEGEQIHIQNIEEGGVQHGKDAEAEIERNIAIFNGGAGSLITGGGVCPSRGTPGVEGQSPAK